MAQSSSIPVLRGAPVSNLQLKESRHHDAGDDIRIDDENEEQPKPAFASKEEEGDGEDDEPPESFQAGGKKKKSGKKKFGKYDPVDESVREMQRVASSEASKHGASDSWAKAEESVKALSDRIMGMDRESEAKEEAKRRKEKKK